MDRPFVIHQLGHTLIGDQPQRPIWCGMQANDCTGQHIPNGNDGTEQL
jgi:hypothetical protein